MNSSDHTDWAVGYQAGHHRGRQDGAAETVNRYTRDPHHHGHPDEPPADAGPEWVDGFLHGYADGRGDAMRGAA